jgi:hypothetical protein
MPVVSKIFDISKQRNGICVSTQQCSVNTISIPTCQLPPCPMRSIKKGYANSQMNSFLSVLQWARTIFTICCVGRCTEWIQGIGTMIITAQINKSTVDRFMMNHSAPLQKKFGAWRSTRRVITSSGTESCNHCYVSCDTIKVVCFLLIDG